MKKDEMLIQQAREVAKKFCRASCNSSYPTCERCQKNKMGKVPLIGSNTVCPLAGYGIPDWPEPTDFIERLKSNPTLDDCFTVCVACEHSELRSDGDDECLELGCGNDGEYESFCLDCPVNQAREALQETAAEARWS